MADRIDESAPLEARPQNVIIFSAGASVRNGRVDYIRMTLDDRNIRCYSWQELFAGARDANQLALLPILIKKIPSFDFALIFAEGIDTTVRSDNAEVLSMRDNVLFEMGLCIMALGVERVILLTDENLHIPDDLTGVADDLTGSDEESKPGATHLAIKHIVFDDSEMPRVGESLDDRLEQVAAFIREQSISAIHGDEGTFDPMEDLRTYINANSRLITPVFVGSSVALAAAYVQNMIIRLLEHVDQPYHRKGADDSTAEPLIGVDEPAPKPGVDIPMPKNIEIEIALPTELSSTTGPQIRQHFNQLGYYQYEINQAGSRPISFHGDYDEETDTLKIYDIPTSIMPSYQIVQTILDMESDESFDASAKERYLAKELDIFEHTLRKLLQPAEAERNFMTNLDDAHRRQVLEHLDAITITRVKLPDEPAN